MSIVESICRELAAGKSLALVSIVKQLASAPRHAGASMLVGEEGLIDGTIGGGILEGEAIELAKGVAARGVAEFKDFMLTGREAASNGMICGGSLRIFIEPLRPDGPTKVLFQRLAIAMRCADDMICVVPVVAPGQRRLCRLAAKQWPIPVETRHLVQQAIAEKGLGQPIEFTDSAGQHFVLEPWQAPWRVIFLGGGHVAQATAKVAASADFTISVLDDREEFANSERFPEAAMVKVVPEFENCFEGLNPQRKTYVVIATRGHQYDRKVLEQSLRTEAGYIGMIGSKKKIVATYAALEKNGWTKQDLDRITAPIGLEIGAETPEEIAVSIVSQLIATRALQHGGRRHLQTALAGRITDSLNLAGGQESAAAATAPAASCEKAEGGAKTGCAGCPEGCGSC